MASGSPRLGMQLHGELATTRFDQRHSPLRFNFLGD